MKGDGNKGRPDQRSLRLYLRPEVLDGLRVLTELAHVGAPEWDYSVDGARYAAELVDVFVTERIPRVLEVRNFEEFVRLRKARKPIDVVGSKLTFDELLTNLRQYNANRETAPVPTKEQVAVIWNIVENLDARTVTA